MWYDIVIPCPKYTGTGPKKKKHPLYTRKGDVFLVCFNLFFWKVILRNKKKIRLNTVKCRRILSTNTFEKWTTYRNKENLFGLNKRSTVIKETKESLQLQVLLVLYVSFCRLLNKIWVRERDVIFRKLRS